MSKSVSPMLLVFLSLVICVTLVLTRAPGLHQAPVASTPTVHRSAGAAASSSSLRTGAPCSLDGNYDNDAPDCVMPGS